MDTRSPEAAWLDFTVEMLDTPQGILPMERMAEQMAVTLSSDACVFHNGGGGRRWRVWRRSDAPGPPRALLRLRDWEAFFRSIGATHHVTISLVPAGTCDATFVLGKRGPYTVEELELATMVQRLMIGIVRQMASSLNAVGDVRPVAATCSPSLTPRENAVLCLVAKGMTAAAAGRRLGIAERTVHKHLERCYAKLCVTDRVSAVLCARRLGMLG